MEKNETRGMPNDEKLKAQAYADLMTERINSVLLQVYEEESADVVHCMGDVVSITLDDGSTLTVVFPTVSWTYVKRSLPTESEEEL